MSELILQLQNLSIWVILILILLVLVIFISFRKTPSSENKRGRLFFISIRSILFVWLFFLILKPFFSWTRIRHQPPKVILWIDNSLSMKSQKGFSADMLIRNLNILKNQMEKKGAQVLVEPFSSDLEEKKNSLVDLEFIGQSTDISQAIHKSIELHKDENIRAGVLISDGVSNKGEDPAFIKIDKRFPIMTVGIGDSTRLKDSSVENLELPAEVRVSDTIRVKAEIIPHGDGKPVQVFLRENDHIVERKMVETHAETFLTELFFLHIVDHPGDNVYSIEIEPTNDVNPYNNVRTGIVRVQAAKKNIVILSSKAGFEAQFLKNMLKDEERYKVFNIVETSDDWIPMSSAKLFQEKWSVLIAIGYPSNKSNPNQLAEIGRRIRSESLPVLVIYDRSLDIDRLNQLFGEKIITGMPDPKISAVSVQITPKGKENLIFRDIFFGIDPSSVITELPPIGIPFKKLTLSVGFISLLSSANLAENPVISIREINGRRTAVCSALDFWRWKFLTTENRQVDFYNEIFLSLVNWLSDSTSASNIQLAFNRPLYLTGEDIEISSLVYDVQGNIRQNASLKAIIQDKDRKESPFALNWDGRRFYGEIQGRSAGKYRVSVSAFLDDYEIGRAQKEILVVDQPIELSKVMQNANGLRLLSEKTGGRKFPMSELNQIADAINYEQTTVSEHHELRLWRWSGSFVILMLLLVGEWVFRRIYGYQ